MLTAKIARGFSCCVTFPMLQPHNPCPTLAMKPPLQSAKLILRNLQRIPQSPNFQFEAPSRRFLHVSEQQTLIGAVLLVMILEADHNVEGPTTTAPRR